MIILNICEKIIEVFNPALIANNKIAKQYVAMIKADWNKNKDLKKVFIVDNEYTSSLTYRISNEFLDCANTGGLSNHYIDIKLRFIKETVGIFGRWTNDFTNARIGASRFDLYKGDRHLFGRDMKTDKLVINSLGINENKTPVYKYLNVSSKEIFKLIKFFINEYETRYPVLKEGKYYNYMRLFEVDEEIKQNYISSMSIKRKNAHTKEG